MYIDDRSSKKIVLIRSTYIAAEPLGRKGFKKGTGRSVNDRFAEFDANISNFEQVSAEVRQQLSDEETQQLKAWFEQRKSRRQAVLCKQDWDKMLARMAKVAEWVDAGGGDELSDEQLDELSRHVWICWDIIGGYLNRKGQLQKLFRADIEVAREERKKGGFVFKIHNKKDCIQEQKTIPEADAGELATANPDCEIAFPYPHTSDPLPKAYI